MDNLSVFLFAIAGISTLVGAFYLMASAARTMPEERHWHPMVDGGPDSKELRQYMRKVTKRVHPEMADVEPGTELMGVTFESKDSCSLEEYKDLQARIDQRREELGGDDWDDEEDDDGGDIVALNI